MHRSISGIVDATTTSEKKKKTIYQDYVPQSNMIICAACVHRNKSVYLNCKFLLKQLYHAEGTSKKMDLSSELFTRGETLQDEQWELGQAESQQMNLKSSSFKIFKAKYFKVSCLDSTSSQRQLSEWEP